MSGLTITLIVLEVLSLLAIVHLWARRRMRWTAKLAWSVFLLLPLFGLVLYGFASINPEPHGEDPLCDGDG